MENKDIIIVKLIGASNVGKTSIFKRYLYKEFSEEDPEMKCCHLETTTFKYKDKEYKIFLIDIISSKTIIEIETKALDYLPGGFFAIFDLTNENSLNEINNLIAYIKQELPSPQIIILGNKTDDINHRINQDIIDKNLNQYKKKI